MAAPSFMIWLWISSVLGLVAIVSRLALVVRALGRAFAEDALLLLAGVMVVALAALWQIDLGLFNPASLAASAAYLATTALWLLKAAVLLWGLRVGDLRSRGRRVYWLAAAALLVASYATVMATVGDVCAYTSVTLAGEACAGPDMASQSIGVLAYHCLIDAITDLSVLVFPGLVWLHYPRSPTTRLLGAGGVGLLQLLEIVASFLRFVYPQSPSVVATWLSVSLGLSVLLVCLATTPQLHPLARQTPSDDHPFSSGATTLVSRRHATANQNTPPGQAAEPKAPSKRKTIADILGDIPSPAARSSLTMASRPLRTSTAHSRHLTVDTVLSAGDNNPVLLPLQGTKRSTEQARDVEIAANLLADDKVLEAAAASSEGWPPTRVASLRVQPQSQQQYQTQSQQQYQAHNQPHRQSQQQYHQNQPHRQSQQYETQLQAPLRVPVSPLRSPVSPLSSAPVSEAPDDERGPGAGPTWEGLRSWHDGRTATSIWEQYRQPPSRGA